MASAVDPSCVGECVIPRAGRIPPSSTAVEANRMSRGPRLDPAARGQEQKRDASAPRPFRSLSTSA